MKFPFTHRASVSRGSRHITRTRGRVQEQGHLGHWRVALGFLRYIHIVGCCCAVWPFCFLLHAIRFSIGTVPHWYTLSVIHSVIAAFFSFINWVLHCRLIMMDLKEWSSPELNNETKKCCTDCKTTKTPLWRGGPAGPKAQQHPFLFHLFHPSLHYGLNYWFLSLFSFFCSDADSVQRLRNQVPEERELFQEERGGGGVAPDILCCEETEVEDVGRRGTGGCVFDGPVLWLFYHSFTYRIPGNLITSNPQSDNPFFMSYYT